MGLEVFYYNAFVLILCLNDHFNGSPIRLTVQFFRYKLIISIRDSMLDCFCSREPLSIYMENIGIILYPFLDMIFFSRS